MKLTEQTRGFFTLAAILGAAVIAIACANDGAELDLDKLAVASLGLLAAAVMLEVALR